MTRKEGFRRLEKVRPLRAIYLCGPIGDPDKPARGGYHARNMRTIQALQERGVEVYSLPYANPGLSKISKIIRYSTSFAVLAARIATCEKYSILHLTGLRRIFLYPELVLVYLAKFRKCNVIYDIRDGLELDEIWIYRSSLYRYFFRQILNAVDLVMVQGDAQVPFVESFTGKRPVLVPNQIDLSSLPDRVVHSSASAVPVIAYAGGLKHEKGISTILEAADILKRRGFEVVVRLAGSGDTDYITDLQAKYSDPEIEWLGGQTNARVLDLFAASHFFLFPTSWPGEGQSNALTEAMACECVPIVSDHGFNAATVGDCGVVLSPDRGATDYADAVQEIWESGQWEVLARRANIRVRERFSSTAVLDHLTEQYAALERGDC